MHSRGTTREFLTLAFLKDITEMFSDFNLELQAQDKHVISMTHTQHLAQKGTSVTYFWNKSIPPSEDLSLT